MNQSFSHILTMTFKHNYFEDGLFRMLELSSSEDTQKLMRDLEIIIKPFQGGFHLLTSKPELLALNSDNDPLQFYLYCRDPYYINYTVLPAYKSTDSLIYFNNLEAVPIDTDREWRLHIEDYVGEPDMFRLSHGQFRINQFDPNKTYVFKHATEDHIPDQSISRESTDSDQITISNIPQGAVRIFEGDTLVDSVYYYPKAVWKKPIGTIELFTKALSLHCKIKENIVEDKIDFIKADYTINFNNRETIWKYFLTIKEILRFNNLTIINSAREQIFESEWVDAKTLVFTSKYKLPLTEHPSDHFQLVDNFIPGQRSETVIIKHLPKPSPEQLFQNDETLHSHIYI